MKEQGNKEEHNYSSGRARALAFMLRKNKPGIAKRKPAPETYEIGQTVESKGVYIGLWKPKDREGNSLGKTFNVFAAPQDLTSEYGDKIWLAFTDTVKHITSLKNWHGHDGGNYKNDIELYKALKNGSYNGEWFIPTSDILYGNDEGGKEVQWDDNLYAYKNSGDLKGTFNTEKGNDDWYSRYWSCTQSRHSGDYAWYIRFSTGNEACDHKDEKRMLCRPVRAELHP